jgi:puromycin-sensitive aminopeptidase
VTDTSTYRLPRTVEPQRYELTLSPDLGAATFAGEERVRVVVHEPVDTVVLNAIELDILEASMVDDDGNRLDGTITLDEAEQRATIALSGTAQPGHWTLQLTFTGILNDKLRGFYRSTFTDGDGVERTIATTQFEATDARRAFPCWDEPDFKAVFAVTLVIDSDLAAFSNSAEIEETDLGNGKTQITFADTMIMSTYLVAFVVGPLAATDPVDVDGVPLRVIGRPERTHLTGFALEVGAHALRFFSTWFGLPYPGDKLDLLALPDFAFGAMENLGCVTFRETLLLIDPEEASRAELQSVADVIAHEIAHMWFGDLVTMKWWNGIWLNEAFATFMELLCVDAFRPEWERWVSFSASRRAAFQVDGLLSTRPIEFPVGRPEEAEGMFDTLTYQKGAAVLRMLEQHLGAEPFRKGIAAYIKKHSYSNTETTDLWDAIEEATGEPARATMDSWIYQGGYPLVSVTAGSKGVEISQQRFLWHGAEQGEPAVWHVPVTARGGVEGAERVERTLLDTASGTIDLGGKPDWVVANAGGWGFFRVRYTSELLRQVVSDLTRLDAVERYNLVSDTWAAVLNGSSPLSDFVELIRLFGTEDDPNVWGAIASPLALLDHIATDDDRPAVQSFARRLLRPAFDRLGWDPVDGEGEQASRTRTILLEALGTTAADPDVRQEAAARHERYLDDHHAIAPDLVTPAIHAVASGGGEGEFTTFLDRFRHPGTPQEELRYLYSLTGFEQKPFIQRTLDLALTEVRTQNAPFVIAQCFGNRVGGEVAWDFVEGRWDELMQRLPNNSISRMLGGVSGLTGPGLASRVHAFLDAHPVPSGQQQVNQALEMLDVNTAFADRVRGDLASTLEEA